MKMQSKILNAVEPPRIEDAIRILVDSLVWYKGWMRDYADSIVRDAIDRTHLLDDK